MGHVIRHHHTADAVRITTAPESRAAERDRRQRRYLISMAIRTVCFIGAVAVGPGWLRWVLAAGAVGLPYIAVVMANNPAGRSEGADLQDPSKRRKELGQ